MAKQVSIPLDDQTFVAVELMAERQGVSVPAFLEGLLRPIGVSGESSPGQLPAITRKLLGALAGRGILEGDYRRHLEERHE